jgi:hypothetical protein
LRDELAVARIVIEAAKDRVGLVHLVRSDGLVGGWNGILISLRGYDAVGLRAYSKERSCLVQLTSEHTAI